MRNFLTALVLIALPTVANGQALGVRMGDPVNKYAGKWSSEGVYEIRVPEPNSEFESYLAFATPSAGICKVVAVGKTHKNDDYGTGVRAAYEVLRAALTARYGRNKSFDFLRSGALWDEPREWVWSIYKDERTLSTFWDAEEQSTLPSSLQAVALEVNSARPTSGAYLSLGYEFSNMASCKGALTARDNRGL
jgi:hypothetical protein